MNLFTTHIDLEVHCPFQQIRKSCIDTLPLDGHVVTQKSSSSPSGQSFLPSHSWACERQTDVRRHSTEGSLQTGVPGTMKKKKSYNWN